MNIEQMSQALGVSTKTGYGLLKSGKVACLKVGRAYRIPKAWCEMRGVGLVESYKAKINRNTLFNVCSACFYYWYKQ